MHQSILWSRLPAPPPQIQQPQASSVATLHRWNQLQKPGVGDGPGEKVGPGSQLENAHFSMHNLMSDKCTFIYQFKMHNSRWIRKYRKQIEAINFLILAPSLLATSRSQQFTDHSRQARMSDWFAQLINLQRLDTSLHIHLSSTYQYIYIYIYIDSIDIYIYIDIQIYIYIYIYMYIH